MKLCNIVRENGVRLCAEAKEGIVDLSALGFDATMEEVVSGAKSVPPLPEVIPAGAIVRGGVFANVLTEPHKIICVGLNYLSHAEKARSVGEMAASPTIFSKFPDALAAHNAPVTLPPWETTYDYEAELVIVMGRNAWNIREDEVWDHIFGFACGNDLSCRAAQKRSTQWLVGKSMPGFAPCGPYIAEKDSLPVQRGLAIRSYVNGELRQDANTSEMIFSCAQIVSYVSKYLPLAPGDLIFTGTPSGVQLEQSSGREKWLRPGDTVDVEIEGIGTLTNRMV